MRDEAEGARAPVSVPANRAHAGKFRRLASGLMITLKSPLYECRLTWMARTSGAQRDRRGISLFIVDKSQSGIDCRDYATVDGRRAADIVFDDVAVGPEMRVGPEGDGLEGLERAVDHAIAALCAEAVGAMDELNSTTRDYARLRKQFG